MIVENTPKIIKTPIAAGETTSEEISLSNYRVATFVVETKAEGEITLTVTGSAEGKEPSSVSFLFKKNGDTEFKETDADGHTFTHTGEEAILWLAVITADMLSKPEFDTVTLTVTSTPDGAAKNLYALLTQPRYTETDG